MENKDKRNGKQQNNQASDREKRVFLDEQYVKTGADGTGTFCRQRF